MQRRAFTLFELLVTITVIATVAAVVVPMMSDDRSLRTRAAMELLISDLEMAQVLNITQPDNPVIMRFDPAANTYWLAYANNPNRPMNRPDTGDPYSITFGEGRGNSAAGVTLNTINVDSNTIGFNAQGGLSDIHATPVLHMSYGDRDIYITIAATTGTVYETTAPLGPTKGSTPTKR